VVHRLPCPDGCRVLSGDRGERDLLADDLTAVRLARHTMPIRQRVE
jgi:hypothetical protein